MQGYREAQRRLSEYKSSLSEVRVRLKNEQESVRFFDNANQKLTVLWARQDLNPREAFSLFTAINIDLGKVKNGTTVYLQAKKVEVEVQNRLNLLKNKL